MSRPVARGRVVLTCWRNAFIEHRWSYCFVALCTIALFVLGCYHLGTPSVWGDEGASISIASQHGMALVHAIAHDGGNLAFYYLVLHLLILAFGTGADTLRLFSVFCAALCVPLAYALATLLASRRAGLFASALTAMTLPLIYWAQQIRGYTLVVALLTGSAIALTIAMRDGGFAGFVWFGVLGLMSCYTELLAVIVVVIQFVTIAFVPTIRLHWRRLLVTGSVMAVVLIPLALMAHARGSRQLFWLGAPKRKQMREVVAFLGSARVNGITTRTSHGLTEATVILVCVAIVVGLVLALWQRSFEPARTVLLGGLWLSVPPVVAYSISIHVTPIFLERYFLLCLPALTLLLSFVLSVVPFAPVGWLGVGLLIGFRSQHIGSTYNITVDDWRTATTMVVNESRPGACVAFYFNDGFVDFAYYLEHRPSDMHPHAVIPRSVLPTLGFEPGIASRDLGHFPAIVESYNVLNPQQIHQVAASCPELFLLSNHDGHNSASSGARAVWSKFVQMRSGLVKDYGTMKAINLGSITIYRFSHLNY